MEGRLLMSIKLGSAPAAWGVSFSDDPQQTPWERYLDEVSQAGYEWTELGPLGYLPTNPDVLGNELRKRNLNLAGGFVMRAIEDRALWPEIEQDVLLLGALLGGLGGKYLVLIDDLYTNMHTGDVLTATELDDEAWAYMIEATHAVAHLAKERFGLRTVFHPHTESHVENEHQIERFIDDTDSALVGLCLDTGHHAYRGGDPIAFIEKHHARLEYLHVKNVDASHLRKVRESGTPLAKATADGLFCEPDAGTVDFLALRDVLQTKKYEGFAIVEHDMYPAPFDKPLPIAKRTRAYFNDIGIG